MTFYGAAMIIFWELERFKSVVNRTRLEIGPLTVFAGANSSGKSTVIQSILLAVQSVQSTVQSRQLVLNGPMVRLGVFRDIVSNGDDSDAISIGLGVRRNAASIDRTPFGGLQHDAFLFLPDDVGEVTATSEFTFSCSKDTGRHEADALRLHVDRLRFGVEAKVDEEMRREEIELNRSNTSYAERLRTWNVAAGSLAPAYGLEFDYEVTAAEPQEVFNERARRLSGRIVGATISHFLPDQLAIKYDVIRAQVDAILWQLLPYDMRPPGSPMEIARIATPEVKRLLYWLIEDVTENVDSRTREAITQRFSQLRDDFSTSNLRGLFRRLPPDVRAQLADRIERVRSELDRILRGDRGHQYDVRPVSLPALSAMGLDVLLWHLSSAVKYLGPLRDDPKPVYPLAGASDSRDVGLRGEFTAAVLDYHKDTAVQTIPPTVFSDSQPILEHSTITLIEAVKQWLLYMGVGTDLTSDDSGKLGHILKVATSDRSEMHDLTQVGVGVSQVLPILVLALLANRGDTLIFEQPELHLHPKVQSRLADFFVAISMLGKQCIVETHSEYLINRLRYRSVVSTNADFSDSVAIYFVEKRQGQSHYTRLCINEYGVIQNWPPGFFDESEVTASAIMRAAVEKRRRSRNER